MIGPFLELYFFIFCFNSRYDMKLEEEMKNYSPFGKGGGGAPLLNASGEAIGKYCPSIGHAFLI